MNKLQPFRVKYIFFLLLLFSRIIHSCVEIVCEFVSQSKGPDFQQVVSEPRARLEEEAAVLRVEKGVAVLGGRLTMCRLHP